MSLFNKVLFSAILISLAGSTSAQNIYFTISGEYAGHCDISTLGNLWKGMLEVEYLNGLIFKLGAAYIIGL